MSSRSRRSQKAAAHPDAMLVEAGGGSAAGGDDQPDDDGGQPATDETRLVAAFHGRELQVLASILARRPELVDFVHGFCKDKPSTMLIEAVRSGDTGSGVLQLLCDFGADAAATDETGTTALAHACAAKKLPDGLLTQLVMYGSPVPPNSKVDPNSEAGKVLSTARGRQMEMWSNLQEASEEAEKSADDLRRVTKEAARDRFNLSFQDPEGLTALHWCVIKRSPDKVAIMLEAGACPNKADGKVRHTTSLS